MDGLPIAADGSVPQQASTNLNADRAGHGADTARTERLVHGSITKSILAAFYAVYDKLGFGFLEHVYCEALAIELRRRGHKVSREVTVPVFYDGIPIARYRLDFVVDDAVVLEIKSTELLNPSDRRQLLNQLKATRFEVGLLLHFGPKPKFYRLIATEQFKKH
jgi:GxxExxY protein